MKKEYYKLFKHYEECLSKHGDNHLGVDWPNLDDLMKRYEVMLDVIRIDGFENEKISLLDFGCGTSMLLQYIRDNEINNIKYSGLDISNEYIDVSKKKFPEIKFYNLDILVDHELIPKFDYIIMNGVFTEKLDISFDTMWTFFKNILTRVYEKSNKGVAFNLMSKQVDWERNDLFHVSLDKLSDFLCKELTRNFIIRNDYGLYEYTTYLLK